MAVFTAMLHDRSSGTVRPDGELGLEIDYAPDSSDRRQLMHGLWAVTKLLFAAGARRVIIPKSPIRIIERGQAYDDLAVQALSPGAIDVTSVHPIASVPMSDSAERAAVDSRGRHHRIAGLWVADGSLFPSSIGVPPQLSIYALGLHVGNHIVATRG
jgi:choline dehydrogenase-like flavoprotein